MDNGKILLAKLSHGGIGEENAYLLGALLASKIHQTALSRQALSQDQRRFFWLHIDEFQNFVVPSIDQTLSGARKYHLGMVLAHQELTQLSMQDKAIAASVIANPYTRICFRMGDRDARTLSEGFSVFDSKDLQSLGIGEAIGRIEQAKYDFSIKTYPLPHIDEKLAQSRIKAIKQASKTKYATPLSEVEKLLKRSHIDSSEKEVPSGNKKENTTPPNQPVQPSKPKKQGKGGDRHTQIQHQLQKVAHDRGFGATVEAHLGDGYSVDLVINTGTQRLACEISVTTTAEHEVSNIQKCLKTGFDHIYLISEKPEHLHSINNLIAKSVSNHEMNKVSFVSPNQMKKEIKEIQSPETPSLVRGYHIERTWEKIDENEKKLREATFAKIVRS